MSKTKYLFAGLGLLGGGLAYYNAKKKDKQPLRTVDKVDLNRYSGKWYEIAAFPHHFEKDCACTTAEYNYNPDEGFMEVINTCLKEGREKTATAKAFPEDASNSRMKVEFQWPFKGKYYIMELDQDYQYVLVGHPNRDYLWVLSRYQDMDEDIFVDLLQIARKEGFDISRLRRTEQFCE